MAAGDLNGDGKPDLAVANSSQTIGGIPGANNVEVLLNTHGGPGPIYFTSGQGLDTAVLPEDAAAADFNGDGKPDLAVAESMIGSAAVFLNTTAPGTTAATFAAKQDFAAGFGTTRLRAADLNGDGQPDLVTVNYNDSNVSVLRNTTGPGASIPAFAAAQNLVTHSGVGVPDTADVAVMDINADGKPDLVVSNQLSNEVSVFTNQTAPGATSFTFAARISFAKPGSPGALAVGDVNGDGKPDLVVANSALGSVSVLLNLTTPGGTPSFGAATDFTTAAFPVSVSIGDLNGDGLADLAVASQGSSGIEVLINTTSPGAASPTFAAHQDFSTGVDPRGHLVIADLNNDGRPDLAIAVDSFFLSILLNTTAPGAATMTFATKADLETGTSPASAASADFNGDGLPDLAVVNSDSGSASVFMRTVPKDVAISSGNLQTVALNTAFAPLKAIVTDVNAMPVQLVPIVYQAIAGAQGATGTFSGPTTVLSDGIGIATAPTLTANLSGGVFSVTATGPDPFGTVATFTLVNTIAAPGNLTATATNPTSVSITWSASPFATAYDVRRYTTFPATSTVVAPSTTALSFTDTVSPNSAYIYAVYAVSPSGGLFAYDLATTVIFTSNPTLTPGSTTVKALDFVQLRNAVIAVQALVGQTQTAFIDSPLVIGSTKIKAIHLGQLRTALDAARTATGVLPAIAYAHAPPASGTPITAADIDDLRNGVK